MNYTIEEVLDHDIIWINHMVKELTKLEFEDMIFQMSLHGTPQERLDHLQNEFKGETISQSENIKIPISQFQNMGLAFGKLNKTKVIRRKK